MQTFPSYAKEHEVIEPYFQVIENNTETVMVVLSVKEGEPNEPSFYFDGEEGLLLRRGEQPVRFVNIPAAGCDALGAAKIVLIVETDDGSISFGEDKSVESELHFSYEVPIQRVVSASKRGASSPLLSALEPIFRVGAWMLVFLFMGFGVQVLYGGDRSLAVTSSDERGKALIEEKGVRYLPERLFYGRIFWTYIVKSERGKFYYPAQEKGKIRVFKPAYVERMGFRPVYSFWYEKGRWILLFALCVGSVGMSFTSFNVYDMLKNAFFGAVQENVEDGLSGEEVFVRWI